MKILNQISKFIKEHNYVWYLLIFIICLVIFGFLQSAATFLDPDSFYHAKITVMIQEGGIVKNFPYLPFTVLQNYYIDHHLLYHLLLIPFVLFLDPLVAIKLASVIFASLFIVIFYWLLQQFNQRVHYSVNLIFSLFLLLCPAFIFRLNLAKAPALSLIFLFLGFYFIVQRKHWQLFFLSWFYVYLYGGWAVILIVLFFYILVSGVGDFIERRKDKKKILDCRGRAAFYPYNLISRFFQRQYLKLAGAGLAGLAAGLIINPYFPKNLKFYWQQLVQIGIINYQAVVRVGMEWHPYSWNNFLQELPLLAILFLLAIILFIINFRRQSRLAWVSLLVAVFFLIITFKSQRYVEYFVPFAVLFSTVSLAPFLTTKNLKKYYSLIVGWWSQKIVWTAVIILFGVFWLIGVVGIGSWGWLTNWHYYHQLGRPFNQFSAAAEWLADNSLAGEVVFHSDWDEFPPLFYYNSYNYYIAGLDPTFLYQQDAGLYKKFENITLGNIENNLAKEIQDNFSARYIFVDLAGHDKFLENLQKDSQIILVYQDEQAKIFQIK